MFDRPHFFINGTWAVPSSTDTIELIAPATEKPLGVCALAGTKDVDAAVAAARDAFAQWAATAPAERAQLLEKYSDCLQRQGPETAAIVSNENGMPISLSQAVNGYAPAGIIRYYAGLIRDEADDIRPGVVAGRTVVQSQPVGVVAAITPWNYPQALAAMKIGPALAAGCTVVLKPAPETAADAYAYATAAEEAGLPAGVINVIPGGRDAGAYLVSHPDVNKVAFTGSTAAGKHIAQECGRWLRPVTLELGGKSAALVCPDADLERFTSQLLDVCLVNNGQTCHASTRILAPAQRYSEVVEAVTSTVAQLQVGDPLEPTTQVGPLVSAAQRERVLDYIELGRSQGYPITTGGGVPSQHPRGWYVEPTVFAEVDNGSTIAQEEIFGPVLAIIKYSDMEEAISLANDSQYGLAGTIWTEDEEAGLALASRIHTGSIGVNHYLLDFAAPFGGVKNSGLGRELGPEGLQAYRQSRSVYFANP